MRISIGNLRLAAGLAAAAAAFFMVAASHAATLDPAVLPKVEAATFEVVQAKPDPDPLTYEKPLPLDLLPYQERTDKYYSIGTAFSIGNGRYVTAAHVLLAGLDSLWGPPALRDSKGKVYPIDKIEKFGLRRDFVVFSLATQPGGAALEIDSKPATNDVVYAVGNALGTGVVIRDGLYTSDTPEQQDGAWKWMRFSAAASPGNSGGPLLDKDGKVIGVVLAKSPNENLNYALPIQQVLDAPDNQAVLDERAAYQLDIFDATQSGIFKTQFALPKSLSDFYQTYEKLFDAFNDNQLKALLAKESANLFPNGAGARRLLFMETHFDAFPTLIVRDSSGEWNRVGSSSQHYTLSGNGYVDLGSAGRNGLIHLRRPDDMPPARFYGDASTRMELLTGTGIFQRAIATENVKITSLGKPTRSLMRTDAWQRHWNVNVWTLPYMNALVVVYELPVPDGSVMLMRAVPASNAHDTQLDMDELTNFIYVSYEGTLAQWKEFLDEPTLFPDAFKNLRIDFDYGKHFSYASQRVAFSYSPDVQAITPDGLLWLGFRFFLDKGKPAWDVTDVQIFKDKASDNDDDINIERFDEPPAGLDDEIMNLWQQIAQRSHHFNGVARYDNDQTKIDGVVAPAASKGEPAKLLYIVYYSLEGNHPQDFMKSKLDLLMKDLQVKEH